MSPLLFPHCAHHREIMRAEWSKEANANLAALADPMGGSFLVSLSSASIRCGSVSKETVTV